jgi:hypothetical protein
MSVLPASASFISFFIVLAILFLATIFVALYLVTFLSIALPILLRPIRFLLSHARHLQRQGVPRFIQKYFDLLNSTPSSDLSLWDLDKPWRHWPLEYASFVFRGFLANIVHYGLVKEIFFLRDLYVMLQYRGHVVHLFEWRCVWLVRDVVRFVFLPVWVALIVVFVAVLLVQDILICPCRVCFWVLPAVWREKVKGWFFK